MIQRKISTKYTDKYLSGRQALIRAVRELGISGDGNVGADGSVSMSRGYASSMGGQPGGIGRVVERQMRNWELARAQRQNVPASERDAVADFVAISREVGTGASEVAALIASRLEWPKFDNEILHAMTADDATRKHVYTSMDERDLAWWEEVVRPLVEPDFRRNDYFRRLVKTALSLARQGSAVFLGRGVDFMLPRELGFRARLVAPEEMRIERFARRHDVYTQEARRIVARVDRERAEFVAHHFHAEINDPTRCDLTLNMEHFTPQQAAEAILAARDAKQRHTHSAHHTVQT